jgi:hypothetical protein
MPAEMPLDTLQTLLATARGLLKDLVGDPQVDRLLRAFLMLPEADREPILQVLEKDASWRQIVEQTDGATGITVRPNPHASLYVHVLDQVTHRPIEPTPSPRDADVIRQGIDTFVQLLPLLFQDAVYAQWTAAAREIARTATAELRALAARMAREVLAIVAEIDAGRDRDR